MATDHAQRFVEFLVQSRVLKFGDFTLKSGRQSPYFINLGEVASGSAFATLGQAYADAILAAGIEVDVLFGPAYKGIPIAVAAAVALASEGMDVGVAYNRKEAKGHGEGGQMVGAELTGRVLMIDDVLTSGKAIREALAVMRAHKTHELQAGAGESAGEKDLQIVGALIALDRQEMLEGERTAVEALSAEIDAPVISIAKMTDLIQYLENNHANAANLERMRTYQAQYCTSL